MAEKEIKLIVHREWSENFEDVKEREALHKYRSKLLHGLVNTLDLDVKDCGETDSDYPREVVEIITALGSAGVFAAMVFAFKVWMNRKKIRKVEIEHDGKRIVLDGATADDVAKISKTLGLGFRYSK